MKFCLLYDGDDESIHVGLEKSKLFVPGTIVSKEQHHLKECMYGTCTRYDHPQIKLNYMIWIYLLVFLLLFRIAMPLFRLCFRKRVCANFELINNFHTLNCNTTLNSFVPTFDI